MFFSGTLTSEGQVQRACDLLLAALVLPSLLLHLVKYTLVFLFPLFNPVLMREVLGWTIPVAYLFLATPLSLLALPGAFWLVRVLPEPPAFALFMRVLAVFFALLTVAATIARFTGDMPTAAGLQDAAGMAKLAVALGIGVALLSGRARAPRFLLLLATAAFAAALLLQGYRVLFGGLSPRFMFAVRSVASTLLAASLLLARR
jgi:hypothetical protein